MHFFSRDRVEEVELPTVESLTFHQVAGAAVHIVTGKRHAERREMYSYLMCASRFKVNFQQCKLVSFFVRGGDCKILQRLPVRDGADAAFADLALYAVSFHDPDRRVGVP